MAIDIPALPRGTLYRPTPMFAGGPLTAMSGSSTQRMDRRGDKWSIEVTPPPGRVVSGVQAARMQANAEQTTLVMAWPQPRLIVPIGAPLVAGAGQSGTSLTVDGLTPNIVLPALRFFSFNDGTRHYLHQLYAQVVVNTAGEATLSFWPMLRVVPDDDLAIEMFAPKIEGLSFSAADYSFQYGRRLAFSPFVIAEND